MQGTPSLDGTGDPGSTRLTIDHWDPEQMLEFPDTVDGLLAQVSDTAFSALEKNALVFNRGNHQTNRQ